MTITSVKQEKSLSTKYPNTLVAFTSYKQKYSIHLILGLILSFISGQTESKAQLTQTQTLNRNSLMEINFYMHRFSTAEVLPEKLWRPDEV